jgi:membrane dipeptidase
MHVKKLATALLSMTFFWSPMSHAQKYDDPQILSKVAELHQKILTLDTHGDLPNYMVSRPTFDVSVYHDARKTGSRIDLPRMKEGGLDAIFLAVYLGQGPRTEAGYADAKKRAWQQVEIIQQMIQKNSHLVGLATSRESAWALKRQGKRAFFMGVENGWAIGKDLSMLQQFYDVGARYMTLSHTRNNDICDSSTDPAGYEHQGLSAFGKEVVAEMNRIGMLIDVSHISDQAVWDCLKISKAPIVATHSSASAVYKHARNLNDDLIKAIAASGGVIQMNMLSSYLKGADPKRTEAMNAFRAKYPSGATLTEAQQKQRTEELAALNAKYPEQLATLSMVMDHIDHIVKLVGVDHVGIGPDLDGGGGVTGMYDVSEMKNITYELVKRGYSDQDIAKIWSENFFRVMDKAQEVARALQKQ